MTFSKFAVISLLVLVIMGLQPGRAAATTSTSSGDQVTVCHFPGHKGDFVTFNSEQSGNPLCDSRGGNAITITEEACENGHHAEQIFGNRTCADGNLQP